MKHRGIISILLACCIPIGVNLAEAVTIQVPTDQPTISKALEKAFTGDKIVISAGEYKETFTIETGVELVFAGRDKTTIIGDIRVTNPGGAILQAFSIQGQISFNSTKGELTDVTVTKGGVYCGGSSPKIYNVKIADTTSVGISCSSSSPSISNVTIENTGSSGISCKDKSSPSISNVIIKNAGSDGIQASKSTPNINQVTISQTKGSGISCTDLDESSRGFPASHTIINWATISQTGSYGMYFSTFGISGTGTSGKHAKISNVTINNAGSDGIYSISSQLEVDNVTINQPKGNGIVIASTPRNYPYRASGYLTIKTMVINGAGSAGIQAIQYGWNSYRGDLFYAPNIPYIDGATITKCKGDGIHIAPSNSIGGYITATAIRNCLITENEGRGIYTTNSSVNLKNGKNQIYRNRGTSVYSASGLVNAIGNWWGTASPLNEFFVGNVTYDPWLKQQPVTCTIGDVNGDGSIKSIDASLTLRIAAQLISSPTEIQKCAADMNGDGNIKSIDASLILRKAAGLPPSAAPLRTDVSSPVVISNHLDVQPDKARILIQLSQLPGILAADFKFGYDPKRLQLVSVDLQESFAGCRSQINIRVPGQIILPICSQQPITGSFAHIMEITFRRFPEQVRNDSSSFEVTEVILWDTSGHQMSTEIDFLPLLFKYLPEVTRLRQNYPNPFNPETWIPFELAVDSQVMLSIHDIPGNLIRNIDLGLVEAGSYLNRPHAVHWDGTTETGEMVASGTYFYTMQTNHYTFTQKMIILK